MTVRLALVAHAVLALILVWVPLFDGLGFERALATGLLTAVTSPLVAIAMVRRSRRGPGADLGVAARRALLINFALLMPSLAVGAAVEALFQSCEPDMGVVFMLLVAGGNAVVGTAIGAAASLLTFRGWAPFIAVVAVLVGALVGVVLRFYTSPQIFIYSAPWGFWPGSVYDESLAVDARLWAFRFYCKVGAASLFALAVGFSRAARPTLRPSPVPVIAGVVLALGAAWAAHQGKHIGWNMDRDAVQDVLRARVETDHFIIYADPSVDRGHLQRIAEDHEHRYQQLTAFFQAEPNGKVLSYVYRDRNQKAELIGARGTQIARPWVREIHIDGFDVPHRILKHELAHVFGSARARGPFKVPAFAGLFVNIGVVEGAAVAADWPVRELTVHAWTKAMQGLGLMPDLRKSLDVLGFWSISSSRAYTVAGSFLRYLIDTYGIEKFWVLYGSNSFERAYDRSLDELVTEWEGFLDSIPLPKDDLVIAEHRFKRPSIFQKVCAHVSANTAVRGYGRLYAGDLEGAREDLEQIYGYAPADPAPLIALAEAYGRAGDFETAASLIARAAEAPGATVQGQTRALEAEGNLAWRQRRFEDARRAYVTVRQRHLSTPSDRLQQARVLALTRSATSTTTDRLLKVLSGVLLGDDPTAVRLVRLAEASVKFPEAPLVHYLYARALENAGAYSEGVAAAARALDGSLGGDPLATEARLTYGRLLWKADRPREAVPVFEAIAEKHTSPAIRAAAEDWADRARFSTQYR